MATFLPEDLVLFEILTKLPAKSLIRFRCVSKIWKTCISSNRSFIDVHLRQQRQSEDNPMAIILYNKNIDDKEDEGLKVDDEHVGLQVVNVVSGQFSKVSEFDVSYVVAENGPIDFVGSCEGLVCLTCDEFPEQVLLWNPATRQLRQLPCLSNVSDLWSVGFGLDNVSGNWKVVCLFLELNDESPFEPLVRAQVFAKRDTVWRDCGASRMNGYPLEKQIPKAAAGALHWKFATRDEIDHGILSFDLTNEVFRLVDRPNCLYFDICEWRSSLAAFTFDYDDDGNIESGYVSVVSPSSFGEGLSWSKLVKLTPQECRRADLVWRGQLLLSHYDHGSMLSLVDPQAREEATNLKQFRFDFHPHGSYAFYDYVLTITPVF